MIKFLSRGLAAVVLTVASLSASAEVINLMMPKLASGEMIALAIQKHYPAIAKKYGDPDGRIEIQYTRSSAEALNTLIQGQTQLNVTVLPAIVTFNHKQPGVVKFLSMANTSDGPLVCRPYVKDIQDIKKNNYTVLIAGRLSGSHLTLMKLGKQYFNDVTAFENNIVLMGQQQTLQALLSGTKGFDCAIAGSPVYNELVEKGMKVIFNDKDFPGFQNSYAVNVAWANKNPNLVQALLETIKVAQREFNTNPEPLAQLMIDRHQLTGVDAKTIARYYRENNIVGFTKFTPPVMNMLKFAEEVGMVPKGSLENFEKELILRPDLL